MTQTVQTESASNSPKTLDAWLAHAEALSARTIDLGLDRMREMIGRLDIHFDAPVVTVGGTNGKGSTCTFIESAARAAGLRTALHTSPHLLRFTERARLNGEEADEELLGRAFARVEAARGELPLTYFEFTALGILLVFEEFRPDLVILEIGLGGRLDAINAIDPTVSVITSIGVDHTAFLGDTREAIAWEKAHIFRPGRFAICADPEPPATLVNHAREIGAKLLVFRRDFDARPLSQGGFEYVRNGVASGEFRPGLEGENQLRNAAGALTALRALSDSGFEKFALPHEILARGVANARITGRFERVCEEPCLTILDVGHNPEAARALAANLAASARPGERTIAVFGMLRDKDRTSVIRETAPRIDEWFYAGLPGPRGGSAEDLGEHLLEAGVPQAAAEPCESVAEALGRARVRAKVLLADSAAPVRIIVFGSFVTVKAALEELAREGVRR